MGRHVFLHEVVDCPLVSGGYCFLLCPPLPLEIVRFIPPPSKAGESSCYVLKVPCLRNLQMLPQMLHRVPELFFQVFFYFFAVFTVTLAYPHNC